MTDLCLLLFRVSQRSRTPTILHNNLSKHAVYQWWQTGSLFSCLLIMGDSRLRITCAVSIETVTPLQTAAKCKEIDHFQVCWLSVLFVHVALWRKLDVMCGNCSQREQSTRLCRNTKTRAGDGTTSYAERATNGSWHYEWKTRCM